MSQQTKTEDTIAAIATPLGEGGIGIVRLSGPHSIDIARAIFRSSRNRDIGRVGQRVFHGAVLDGDMSVDEVLVHVMPAPHSYTREDVVEINCHGGPAPLQCILELALRRGARLAQPGEFTRRAFLNGRIDLIQAEAVIDRIRAGSRAALRAADAAARGSLSRAIYEIRDVLVDALARVEAAVDFPEDDLPELVDDGLRDSIRGVLVRIQALESTAHAGRLYREGARVPIAGRPNVGKSSLFNALLRDARAIVTAQPGTTRDLLEEAINICGIPVRLADTAGLRATSDEVERIGIEIAREAVSQADAVIFVVDVTSTPTHEEEELARKIHESDTPLLLAVNKLDLAPGPSIPPWTGLCSEVVGVSAKTGANLGDLESALGRILLGRPEIDPSAAMITRMHQQDSLRRAGESLARGLGVFSQSPEFLSIDLRETLQALGEITGETTPDDVLDRIFASFCIGK